MSHQDGDEKGREDKIWYIGHICQSVDNKILGERERERRKEKDWERNIYSRRKKNNNSKLYGLMEVFFQLIISYEKEDANNRTNNFIKQISFIHLLIFFILHISVIIKNIWHKKEKENNNN
jgi:hypothetical protein